MVSSQYRLVEERSCNMVGVEGWGGGGVGGRGWGVRAYSLVDIFGPQEVRKGRK